MLYENHIGNRTEEELSAEDVLPGTNPLLTQGRTAGSVQGGKMRLYEMVTPSDSLTFYAEDEKIAIAVTLFIGGGKAGLLRENGEQVRGTLLLFTTGLKAAATIDGLLGMPLGDFIEANRLKIADAMDTFATMDRHQRTMIDEARNYMTPENFRKFRASVDDKARTSLSAWSEYAWKCADRFRQLEDESAQDGGAL